MARVLSGISLDAPTSPVSANVNDTFNFAGSPSFTGGGGVQRYDFQWQVDSGSGYVTIASSGTGLITSGTNPIVNTNKQSQNSITVTCNQAGSYTIRMAGAPVSGGVYTIFSSTQTVTVSAPSVPYSADLTAPSFGMSGQSLTRFNAFTGLLSSPAFGFTGQTLTRLNAFVGSLTMPSFGFSAQSLTRLNAYISELSASAFTFTAQTASFSGFSAYVAELTAPALNFTAQSVNRLNAYIVQLTSPVFSFIAQPVSRFNAYVAQLSSAAFWFSSQSVDVVSDNPQEPMLDQAPQTYYYSIMYSEKL